MSLKINNNLTTINFNDYRTKAIEYIVVHYTANDGDTAQGNTKYFKDVWRGASAHLFVDETDIWRSVLDEHMAWHCGTTGTFKHAACRNSNSIGIEMCSRKDASGMYYIKDETIDLALELVRELTAKYNIPPGNVLRHYDVTGKICPEPFVRTGLYWFDFKLRLEDDNLTQQKFNEMYAAMIAENHGDYSAEWAREATALAKEKGIFAGDGAGNFDWQEPMTREAFAVVLMRLGLI